MHKEFEIKEVTFDVDGATVVGTLRIPDSARPLPALAVAGPIAGVKDQVTDSWGKAMAHRGYMTLSFDHRYFGASSGEPRQYEYPRHKVADIRAAFGYLAHRTETNPRRIGALGICAGAGYMAGAVVKDDRVRSWAAVAGVFHDVSREREWLGERYQAEIDRARQARAHYDQTGEVLMVPAVGKGDVILPTPEALEYFGTARGATPNYRNEVALMSKEHLLSWDVQALAPKIKIPTLMIHSERATSPDLARSFYEALAGNKEQQWVETAGQLDFYDDHACIDAASAALAWHFRNTM